MNGVGERPDVEVSVIIPALEATPHALNVVRRLALQEQAFTFEVLLVLNHAPREIEADLPPRGRILFCEIPGSYAARNAGLAEARGRVLAFTDSDVTPHANWLSEGYEACATTSFNMLVAGAITMYHEKKTAAAIYDGGLYLNQERYAAHGTAATANLWVPRAVFEKAGLFREDFHAAGDGEFCLRAKQYGVNLIYSESAIVFHPTRWRLRDLLLKERRLAGGRRNLVRTVPGFNPHSEVTILLDQARRIRESMPFIRSLPILAVAVVVFAARSCERILIGLGKPPERL